jgi:hypothetical protein
MKQGDQITLVIPAEAGIQILLSWFWIPVSTGMSEQL